MSDVRRFEAELLEFVGRNHKGIYDSITGTGKLGDDVVGELEKAVTAFKRQFQTGEGQSLASQQAPAEPLGEGERGQETITRYSQPKPANSTAGNRNATG